MEVTWETFGERERDGSDVGSSLRDREREIEVTWEIFGERER
jgi:hypothetical protein